MARQEIPRYELNEEELDPRVAKRFIADELQLVRLVSVVLVHSGCDSSGTDALRWGLIGVGQDGIPALNLASFVTTYQEPEAEELMRDSEGAHQI